MTYFARVHFRDWRQPFGIKHSDRLFHMYLLGRTGTGKSTCLETMICQDIARGFGVAVVDPHGDLAEAVAKSPPASRRPDVVFLDAPNPTQPYGYNPLKSIRPDKRPLAASGLLEVLRKLWDDRSWGPRMEHILRNAILALLDQPQATLPDILRLLADRSYRKQVATGVTNPAVRRFWLSDYERFSPGYRADSTAPIVNKVGAFLADPILARILTQPKTPLHFRSLMDQGKVLLVNLAKGRLGEDTSALLGGLLVTTLGLAAFTRAEVPDHERRDFFVYLDEFQTFTTRSLANMLSELRKYRVGLVLAHQYLYQLSEDVRYAVLGNVGTIVAFRVGAQDAGFLSKEFATRFEAEDLINLANHHILVKLMIDGEPSKPFSAVTLTPGEGLRLHPSAPHLG
jgi:hypothetical protein